MALSMTRLMPHAHDVLRLKSFYQAHFDLALAEEIDEEWVVLKAGDIEIALHRVGQPYRGRAYGANNPN
jgi:hypothetical protein